MKIDYSSTNRLTSNGTDSASGIDKKSVPHSGEQRPGRMSGKDQASLSEQARLLAKAHAALDETETQRSERVAAIKEKVAAGNYEIPIDALAHQLAKRFRLSD
jgi:flagellar biosynthesis anti-sigma factor FlgM